MTQFYAVLDGNNIPTAFYNDDIYPPQAGGDRNAAIPAAAITITEAQWQQALGGYVQWSPSTSAWVAYTPPPVVQNANSISRAQFFQQLALTPDPSKTDGSTLITPAQAVAAMSGTIPPVMANLVAQLPASEQLTANMKLAGATAFDIDNPITLAIAQSYGWSSATIQTFWNNASTL